MGYEWALFYGPIGVCIGVGTLAMSFLICTILKVMIASHLTRRSSDRASVKSRFCSLQSAHKTSKSTLGAQFRILIRPLLFVSTFRLLSLMVFSYRAYAD